MSPFPDSLWVLRVFTVVGGHRNCFQLLWGIVLSQPFKWLLPQPLGFLLVYSHLPSNTELHTAREPSEDLQTSLCSSFLSSAPPSTLASLDSQLHLFNLERSLYCNWLPLPYSTALKVSPAHSWGNLKTHIICFLLSKTAVFCCLISNILKSLFLVVVFFLSCFKRQGKVSIIPHSFFYTFCFTHL